MATSLCRGRPNMSSPPSKPGCCRIKYTDGRKPYYGISNKLSRRSEEHLRNPTDPHGYYPENGDSFEWKSCPPGTLREVKRNDERRKIAHHDNSNGNRGGGGNDPKPCNDSEDAWWHLA